MQEQLADDFRETDRLTTGDQPGQLRERRSRD
jgi:hypothetical protein